MSTIFHPSIQFWELRLEPVWSAVRYLGKSQIKVQHTHWRLYCIDEWENSLFIYCNLGKHMARHDSICCNLEKRTWISLCACSPSICFTLFGWGLCREKNEWWLKAPKLGLLFVSIMGNSGVNGTGWVWLRLLSPVILRESGLCAIDMSWNDRWRFLSKSEGVKEKL